MDTNDHKAPQPEPNSIKPPTIWSWRTYNIWAVVFVVFYIFLFFFGELGAKSEFGSGLQGFFMRLLISVTAGCFLAFFIYGPYVIIRKGITLLGFEIGKVTYETDQLQADLEKDFFTNLVRINFKYLDKYYLQTQVQANKSFILSAASAVIGLIIVAAGIILMYRGGPTTPAYVTTATGAFSEFIATVFFYLYNQTVLRMSEYHQKLVLTQNISLSLKISEGLPDEDRVKAQIALIHALTQDINSFLSGVGETRPHESLTRGGKGVG